MDEPDLNSSDEVEAFLSHVGLANVDTTATSDDLTDIVSSPPTPQTPNFPTSPEPPIPQTPQPPPTQDAGYDGDGSDASENVDDSVENEVTFNAEALPPPDPTPTPTCSISVIFNRILASNGFESNITSLHSSPDQFTKNLELVMTELTKHQQTIEKMSYNSPNHPNSSMNLSFNSVSDEQLKASSNVESQKRKLDLQLLANDKLQKTIDSLKKKAATEIRKLKTTNDSLTRSVQQEKHRINAKDAIIQRLTDKAMLEEKKKTSTNVHRTEVFKQIQHRIPRKASPVDNQTLDVIGMYETQKEETEDELYSLRNEVQQLNESLREKENVIMKKEFDGAWKSTEENIHSMTEKFKEQEKANHVLQQKESSFARKLEKLENALTSTKNQMADVQDENANLILELKARPSVKTHRQSERRIDELERKLYSAVEAASESADVRELKKFMGTKALIDQDKSNHRLSLERLDALPREISKEILKQTCRELEISDVTLIAPCIQKLNKAMLMLPRMERFINDVCELVFDGLGGGRRTMEDVVPILKKQYKQLNSFGKNVEFKTVVMGELCRRSVVPSDARKVDKKSGITSRTPGMTPDMSDEQALRAIRDLVELEKAIMARDDLYSSAESVVSKNPDLFVNRVVLHFRYLFGIKNMEGVFPKMNEVYLFCNECDSFMKELKVVFGLSSKTTTANVIKSALDICGEMQGEKTMKARVGVGMKSKTREQEEEEEEHENYVVM